MKSKIEQIEDKVNDCEIMALKIKAVNFTNFQSFDNVHNNYEEGEPYNLNGIGNMVVTKKTNYKIKFVVFMKSNSIWGKHWQDVDKILDVKQGTYLDLFTKKEYKDEVKVNAYEISHFKSIGEDDLVLKGEIYKTNVL